MRVLFSKAELFLLKNQRDFVLGHKQDSLQDSYSSIEIQSEEEADQRNYERLLEGAVPK